MELFNYSIEKDHIIINIICIIMTISEIDY